MTIHQFCTENNTSLSTIENIIGRQIENIFGSLDEAEIELIRLHIVTHSSKRKTWKEKFAALPKCAKKGKPNPWNPNEYKFKRIRLISTRNKS